MMIANEFNYETRCKGEGFVKHPCERERSLALARQCEVSAKRLEARARELRQIATAEYDKLKGWEEVEE